MAWIGTPWLVAVLVAAHHLARSCTLCVRCVDMLSPWLLRVITAMVGLLYVLVLLAVGRHYS